MKPPETRPPAAGQSPGVVRVVHGGPKVLSGFGKEPNRRQRRAMEASRRTRLTAERQKQIRDANKPDKGPENGVNEP